MKSTFFENEDLLIDEPNNNHPANKVYNILIELGFIKACASDREDEEQRDRDQWFARRGLMVDLRSFEKEGMELRAHMNDKKEVLVILDDVFDIIDPKHKDRSEIYPAYSHLVQMSFCSSPKYRFVTEAGFYFVLLKSKNRKRKKLLDWFKKTVTPDLYFFKGWENKLECAYQKKPAYICKICKDWLTARRDRILTEQEHEKDLPLLDTEDPLNYFRGIKQEIESNKRREAELFTKLGKELTEVAKSSGRQKISPTSKPPPLPDFLR